MKLEYFQPVTEVVKIELQAMMAATEDYNTGGDSPGGGGTGGPPGPGGMGAKKFNAWDTWDSDEESE